MSAFFSFLSLAAAAAAAPLVNFFAAADFPLVTFLVLSVAFVSFLSPALGLAAVLDLSFLGTTFLTVFGAAGSTAAFLAGGAVLGASAAFFLIASFLGFSGSFLDFSDSFLDLLSALPVVDFLGAGPDFSFSVDGRLVPLSEALPCLDCSAFLEASAFLEVSALSLGSSFFSAGFFSIGAGAAFLSIGFFSAGAFLSPVVFFSGTDFFSWAGFLSAAGFFSAAGFLSACFLSDFLTSSNGAGAGCFFSDFFSEEPAAGFFSLPDDFLSPPPLPDAVGLAKI